MNEKKVNLLLPKGSKLIIGDTYKMVTALRIKKINNKKKIKIQVLNGKEKVFEQYLTTMSVRLKSGDDFITLEVLNKSKTIIYIHGNKFLQDNEIKKYVSTLII